MALVCPPALQDRQAVHAGQTEIQDDGSIILGVALEPGVLAVDHDFDNISRTFKRARNIRCDPRVILDNKYAHHFSFVRSIRPLRTST